MMFRVLVITMKEQLFWASVCRKNLYKYGGDLCNIWIQYQKEQLLEEVREAREIVDKCEAEIVLLKEALAGSERKIVYYMDRLKKAQRGTLTWELCHYELKVLRKLPHDLRLLSQQRKMLLKQLAVVEEDVNMKLDELSVSMAEMYFENLFRDGVNPVIWAGLEFLVS